MRRASWSCLVVVALALSGAGPAWADSPPANPAPREEVSNACHAVPVRSVDHVAIEQGAMPKIVVSGTAASAGWTKPEVRFRSITKFRSHDAAAVYAFVACPPAAGAEVVTPIATEALWNLAPQLGRVYRIVVEAATNSATLELDKH